MLRNDAALSEAGLAEAIAPSDPVLTGIKSGAWLGCWPILLTANEGTPEAPTLVSVKATGVVVRVIPLYIMVTEGHTLPLENGPPDFGKQ